MKIYAGLFLKFDCGGFSRHMECKLDYFSKEYAKENLPGLLMHAMNSSIYSNHSIYLHVWW